ncbi:Asp domain-containing protein/Aa_trans domain-containing protein, partial [Cephalotus follicularis]
MTPPPLTFLRTSSSGISTSLSPAYKRHRTSEVDFSLTKPLIDPRLSVRSPISSYQNLSSSELPLRQQQSSFAQAVLNGINVLCGIGLYTTPYAVREGGWLSLLILLFFGIISCYTGILLKRCLESFPGLQTYPDIGQAAFGLTGRLLLSILLYIELYAASVELVIMMSDNLSTLFPNAYLNLAGILYLDSHQLFAITATLIALPTVWLRDLSLLSYLSVGGVVSSMLVMLCLLWVGVMDEVGFHPGGTALNLADLSVAIGIYSYAYSGHSVLPNLYSSMKEPSRFPMVLIASFIFCFFMYAGVAIGGFLMFGDSIESQFTLNMPKELVASKIAVWTAVVNPLTKYALTITPVALSLEELIPSSRYRSHVVSIFIRTILVISTVIVALTVPFFGLMMALIGSSVAMLVALIFPPACYISIFKDMNVYNILKCYLSIAIQIQVSFSSLDMLVLPMKTQVIPRSPNKLTFHHNVSLTVSLTIGTPPQSVSMVIDTGSELSWLHCNKTETYQKSFDPTHSHSYCPIPCSSPICKTRTRDFPIPTSCDSKNLCHAILSYADASSSEGNLATDTFHIGSSDISGLVFGCMDSIYSSNEDEDSKDTGLMGMNRGSLSFVSQMGFPKFSYCISGNDFSGLLLLGD